MHQPSTRIQLLSLLVIVAALWLPRGLALDRFVTIDENRWLTRSANFQRALVHGEYIHTYQHGHPGVTIMWLGGLGYLWRYPDYANDAPGEFGWENSEFETYLRTQEHDALDLLAVGRTFAVLASVLALTLAFWAARRLLGLPIALLGFLLIAFDPFEVALTRFLHLDGLLSSWMLLALLLYLCYLYRGRRWRDLIGSAVAAGLAWLTKTPGLFLLPIVGVLALIELAVYVRHNRALSWWRGFWQRAVAPALLWALLGAVVYVALWPAMWVDPLGTLQKVFAVSGEYAVEGHSNPLFLLGEIVNGDPGFLYYPLTWLWRSTPVVLLGLLLAFLAGIWSTVRRQKPAQNAPEQRGWIALSFVVMALLFMVLLNVSAKKLDRYLVPIYPALALVAAYGYGQGMRWLQQWMTHRRLGMALAGAVVALQLALLAPTYPYYMSYYNPLLGGAAVAAQQLTLGWGEGLDEAARYLRSTQDEATTRVAAWYRTGPFDYFYKGTVVSPQYYWFADYIVTYVNQWQRQMPARQIMAYLDRLSPEKTIAINGTDYAKIYNLRTVPLPNFVTDWGGVIRLISYTMPTGDIQRGQQFDIVLQLVNLGPLDTDLNLLLRVVNQEGVELARYEWRPAGIATTAWKKDELWHHRTTVEVPLDAPAGLYRVEVAFFDPDTFARLPAVQANSGAPLGDTLVLDYLVVEQPAATAAQPLEPPADLDQKVTLLGTTITHGDGTAANGRAFQPGEPIHVQAFWQTTGLMAVDYTAFGHLVGPDGQLATQHDQQPLGGFVPTTLWYPGQVFRDEFTLELPATATPGTYLLHMGMYDLATLTRRPISRGGTGAGDAVVVAELTVGP
jgi:4-amino-4-deoxy-L-arabinose transferase-like glycosyltransferase